MAGCTALLPSMLLDTLAKLSLLVLDELPLLLAVLSRRSVIGTQHVQTPTVSVEKLTSGHYLTQEIFTTHSNNDFDLPRPYSSGVWSQVHVYQAYTYRKGQ